MIVISIKTMSDVQTPLLKEPSNRSQTTQSTSPTHLGLQQHTFSGDTHSVFFSSSTQDIFPTTYSLDGHSDSDIKEEDGDLNTSNRSVPEAVPSESLLMRFAQRVVCVIVSIVLCFFVFLRYSY
ncbi:hypothetical protein GEMRC1_000092 [Eukaryota sp. GEM-RC1]